MPSFSFLATLSLLAFGLLSPIFFVVRRFLHPEAHSRQRTAILSLVCFLGGVLLYFYAASWKAESSYESIKASYASIQQGLKANPASLSKEHAAIMREAVDSSEINVAQSKQLLGTMIVEAPVAFLIYYSALLLLSWIAGLFRSNSEVAQPQADSTPASEPENPSFLARACMILVLAIGVEGLGIHLYLSNGGKMYREELVWALVNLGTSIAAVILYYLIKGVPRGADRDFAKNILGPSFFWCVIPTISILTRLALFGSPK
jgi:hypothetical protein